MLSRCSTMVFLLMVVKVGTSMAATTPDYPHCENVSSPPAWQTQCTNHFDTVDLDLIRQCF